MAHIEDSYNGGVVLANKASIPHRIVSLAPNVTELLFAVGAGSQVVAVTKWCNFPAKTEKLPKIGDVTVDYEKLLMLKPDLVVAEASLNSETLLKLAALKVRLLILKNQTFADLSNSLRLVGEVTGHKQRGIKEAARLEKGLELLKAVYVTERPLVYLEIWGEPFMTAGPGTFLDDVIKLAGGRNLGAALPVGFSQVSGETILKNNPDVIVIANAGVSVEDVARRPGWKHLSAVKNKKVYVINPDILVRPGPRLLEGANQLFKWLHPN